MNLSNKNIIITGCLGIYGFEITKYLLNQNSKVIGLDIHTNHKKIKFLKKKYIKNFKYLSCDVADKEELTKIKKIIISNFRKIDVLINLASVTDPIENRKKKIIKFEEYSSDEFKNIVSKNVLATFLPCQLIGKEMLKNKKGSIINFSSTYGIVGPDQKIYVNNKKKKFIKNPAYPSSKGAIISFTKYLSSYWGSSNIRVNCVVPGGAQNNQEKFFVKNYSSKTPLGRMADTRDLNGIIHLLCSDQSSYITGSTLVVDGGWTSI